MRAMAAAVVVAAVLSGCERGPYGARAHWQDREVELLIDETASPVCLAATEEALQLWYEHVDYLVPEYVHGSRRARVGQVSVAFRAISDDRLGYTTSRHVFSHMRRADIVVDVCDVRTIAHEIGHALGLEDNHRPRALMQDGLIRPGELGTEISAAESEWVR